MHLWCIPKLVCLFDFLQWDPHTNLGWCFKWAAHSFSSANYLQCCWFLRDCGCHNYLHSVCKKAAQGIAGRTTIGIAFERIHLPHDPCHNCIYKHNLSGWSFILSNNFIRRKCYCMAMSMLLCWLHWTGKTSNIGYSQLLCLFFFFLTSISSICYLYMMIEVSALKR